MDKRILLLLLVAVASASFFLTSSYSSPIANLQNHYTQQHTQKERIVNEFLPKIFSPDKTPVPGNFDLNTYSNYDSVYTQHFHLNWTIDFTQQIVNASINLQMKALKTTGQVTLDLWKLTLQDVEHPCTYWDKKQGELPVVCFINKKDEDSGDQLIVQTQFGRQSVPIQPNTIFNLTIYYQIHNDSMSMSFLTPEQTGTKVQPYIFTQSQPIYARSLAIFQDTPMVKATWSATVVAPSFISNVFMSAQSVGKTPLPNNTTQYEFNMFNPVPSYLLALVAGNVAEKQLGNRTKVIAEPNIIDEAAYQLEDLEQYLITIENYIQIPYAWKEYRIVIMPPSFPIGGMENPLLTFASPSIISSNHQKSGVGVAIHEIAHSWTGNTVTCANWSSLWLNEGLTVYLERQADKTLFGADYYKTDAINGNSSMYTDIIGFGVNNSFSSIFPNVAGRNPDDAFSNLPYEKGFQFATYLESLIEADQMREFLHQWVANNTWMSAGWQDFQEAFINFVKAVYPTEAPFILNDIDWDLWVKGPGLSPEQKLLNSIFYTPLTKEANNLAAAFISLNGTASPSGWEDLRNWYANEQFIFLQYLFNNLPLLNYNILKKINDCYGFDTDGNDEILWRWYRISPYVPQYQAQNWNLIYTFLGSIGRGKLIDPIYQSLVDTNQRPLAQQTFEHYKSFYHPIQRQVITRIVYGAPVPDGYKAQFD